MQRKLNIGILGTGSIAAGGTATDGRSSGGHAPALTLSSSAQLWSVLSREHSRAENFAKQFGAKSPQASHTDLREMLADPELDAVIVATPDKLHAELTIAASEAGKQVLLEKPMATDSDSMRRMLQACERNRTVLGLAYRYRWHAGIRAIVAAAHAGKFGEIRHVRTMATYLAKDTSNWRASEEVGRFWSLGALGTHLLDLIRWTLLPSAGEVTTVGGVISREVWHGPHDETAVAAFKFESGATAELCSSALFASPHRFEIYGSKGWAVCEDTFGRDAAGRIWTDKGPFEFPIVNPFTAQFDDLVRAVVTGEKHEVDAQEGARNIELLLQLIQN